MRDNSFDKIAFRIGRVACPYCLNTRFSVVLRCDFSTGHGCGLVGVCRHCGAKFDIENTSTLEEMIARTEQAFSQRACPCGSELQLEFLCDVATEDCYFVVVCRACGSTRRLWPPGESGLSLVCRKGLRQ
jgi:hypothetical protein